MHNQKRAPVIKRMCLFRSVLHLWRWSQKIPVQLFALFLPMRPVSIIWGRNWIAFSCCTFRRLIWILCFSCALRMLPFIIFVVIMVRSTLIWFIGLTTRRPLFSAKCQKIIRYTTANPPNNRISIVYILNFKPLKLYKMGCYNLTSLLHIHRKRDWACIISCGYYVTLVKLRVHRWRLQEPTKWQNKKSTSEYSSHHQYLQKDLLVGKGFLLLHVISNKTKTGAWDKTNKTCPGNASSHSIFILTSIEGLNVWNDILPLIAPGWGLPSIITTLQLRGTKKQLLIWKIRPILCCT